MTYEERLEKHFIQSNESVYIMGLSRDCKREQMAELSLTRQYLSYSVL